MSNPIETTFSSEELTHAFEILLGKPLSEFDTDSTYAVFWSEDSETLGPLSYLTQEALRSPSLSDEAYKNLPDEISSYTGGETVRSYDLPGSLFNLDKKFLQNMNISWDNVKTVALWCDKDEVVLTGRALADLGGDLTHVTNVFTSIDESYNSVSPYFRMVCDGTLLDAMAVATGTRGGFPLRSFADLEFATGPAPEWIKPLSQINNLVLREHLGTFCLDPEDARCEFWYFSGPRKDLEFEDSDDVDLESEDSDDDFEDFELFSFDELDHLGWKIIARWDLTEGMYSSIFVVQIPGKEPA